MANNNVTVWKGLFRLWLVGAAVWTVIVLWYSSDSNLSGYTGRVNAFHAGQIIIAVPLVIFFLVLGLAWIARGFSTAITLPKIPENGWVILGILAFLVVFLQVIIVLALSNRI